MVDQLVAGVVDESKWLAASMAVALFAAATLLARTRRSPLSTERRVLAAMNLFFGLTIGTMAIGHLLAVTTRLALGTLGGPVLLFYGIGVVLAVPSWGLVAQTRRIVRPHEQHERTTLVLNGAVACVLLGMGLHNLPLAVPAFLNVGYQLHSRPAVGWAIVGLAVAANLGLFIGAFVFLASGQSFEQFRGIE